jgi:hypothetical protein
MSRLKYAPKRVVPVRRGNAHKKVKRAASDDQLQLATTGGFYTDAQDITHPRSDLSLLDMPDEVLDMVRLLAVRCGTSPSDVAGCRL